MLRPLIIFVWAAVSACVAQHGYVEVRRTATVRADSNTSSDIWLRPDIGSFLALAANEQTDGYYSVSVPGRPAPGWIYRSLVRRYAGEMPGSGNGGSGTGGSPSSPSVLNICSFNIKFLGHYTKKNAAALATLLTDYDIVVVQELVAPPIAGTYPDGTSYTADPESADFLGHMQSLGFQLALSPEDTGRGDTIHVSGTSTEWFATFFKSTVQPANDLPHGFLADDRSANPVYDRVPYASAFRTVDGRFDFVLINVHLKASENEAAARRAELQAIADWVDANDANERDFIVLGDMNIQSKTELDGSVPAGFVSLNDACVRTNLSSQAKPFDHVMFRPQFTTEIDQSFGFHVIDLIAAMQPFWTGPGVYPGSPSYDGQVFPQYYSDHRPVAFRATAAGTDDDS